MVHGPGINILIGIHGVGGGSSDYLCIIGLIRMVESMVTFEHRVPKFSTNLARGMVVVGVLLIASWSATLLSSFAAPRTAATPTVWSLATTVVVVHIVDGMICIYECSVVVHHAHIKCEQVCVEMAQRDQFYSSTDRCDQ